MLRFPTLSRWTIRSSRRGSHAPWLASMLALAVGGGLLTSCTRKSDPHLLARVDSSEIRLEQFQEQMARRGGAKPETLDKTALLEEMIEQETLYVRAVQAGLDKDPEVRRAYRNLVVSKLKERELVPRLEKFEITTEEIRSAYEANRSRYTRPARARLAVLYLSTGPTLGTENVAKLQRRMAEARQKAREPAAAEERGFGSLAISYSEDQATRYKGGEVGWVEKDRGHAWLSPAALNAGFLLNAAGEVSEVVTDSKGVYLVKLLEKRGPEVIPLSEVEPALRQRLTVERRQQIERAFVREARKSVTVEAHPERLAGLVPVAARTPTGDPQPPAFP